MPRFVSKLTSPAAVRAAAGLGLAAVALVLVACNAVKGAGKDLQEASDNTKQAVERATN